MTLLQQNLCSHPDKNEHFVRFYDDDEILLAEVGDFLEIAINAGGCGIVIATREHIQALQDRFAIAMINSDVELTLSQKLITLDAQEMLDLFMVNEWPDENRFDATVGNILRSACKVESKVHAFGEMVALLSAQGLFDAAARLEHLWTELSNKTSFSLFCAYPWKHFPTADLTNAFLQICNAHDHVYNNHPATVLESDDVVDNKTANQRLAVLEQKARALEAEVTRRTEVEFLIKQRETELADFLENSAVGHHRVDVNGTILWANKAELNMLGYCETEYIGHHITEFHSDQAVIEDILARLGAGETLYNYPAQIICEDTSIKHVLITSNACFEGDQLRYTRCSTLDATDRHKLDMAYAEREKLVEELIEANQAKDEFLAMLGHELRNPLAPITLVLDLMRMRNDEAHKKERAVIERQVEHMTRLVNDLLDISRIARGRIAASAE